MSVMENDDTLVWAAHVLSGMARGLAEDVRLGINYSADDRAKVPLSGRTPTFSGSALVAMLVSVLLVMLALGALPTGGKLSHQ